VTPTQRTLRELKKLYNHVDIVERWIPGANIRKDLFGIIDIIALDSARGIIGVQSTGSAFSAHWEKLTVSHVDSTRRWLEVGGVLELWGWRKVKVKRGGKAEVWEPRIAVITLDDIGGSE